ncbi:Riboflavin kinase [Neolecta irregularis DAH-3]|uniref:Riboflavin kinase n=1 Tax=Neolecta irregularis (strain DAH-3) TaxID=1198029 RepID=A0A1U7LQZ7_NEOID|nr:Riboflavin kinase [Neolecta irregularis DAH-3]|eukprot:OLL25085.1 Riboflavin kinase [Neolecta irregularis DAH-3]
MTRAQIVGPDILDEPFPIEFIGSVIKGFGRGSKELGIPTANVSPRVIPRALQEMLSGVYFGWARVINDRKEDSEVFPMCMSLGYNPFYNNKTRSAEVHIMHKFEDDFYGKELRAVVLGFIRTEQDYPGLDELIQDIQTDIMVTERSLAREAYQSYKYDDFLLK